MSSRGGASQVSEQVVVMALTSSLLLLVMLEWRGQVFPSEGVSNVERELQSEVATSHIFVFQSSEVSHKLLLFLSFFFT